MRGGERFVLLVVFSVAACGGQSPATPARPARLYALATGEPGQAGHANRSLAIIDPATWTVTRSVPIGGHGDAYLSLDPSGRPWVVHHGAASEPEASAEVFSPGGDALSDVATCSGGHRAVFLGRRTWIACEENGFQGALARVDLSSLASAAPVALSFEGSDAFSVDSTGLMGNHVLVAGAINTGSGVLSFDDGDAAPSQIPLPPSSIAEILGHGGAALLLNSASGLIRPPGTAPDVIELDGAPVQTIDLAVVRSPRAGVVVGDALLVVGQTDGQFAPTFGKVSLSSPSSGAASWPASTTSQAPAMTTDGAHVFVALERTDTDDTDGLYELDEGSGALTRRLALADVTDLAFAPASASGN